MKVEQEKKEKEKEKEDPIITYLSLVSAHHTSKLDRSYVESVFDSYSITPKKEKDETMVDVSED